MARTGGHLHFDAEVVRTQEAVDDLKLPVGAVGAVAFARPLGVRNIRLHNRHVKAILAPARYELSVVPVASGVRWFQLAKDRQSKKVLLTSRVPR